MLTRMPNKVNAHARPPLLSAAEQTRLSWAKPIQSLADVPAGYKGFFEPLLAAGQAFPYTILAPSYAGLLHRSTEKLICDFGHAITFLERRGSTCEPQTFPYSGISYIEIRSILLDSRIKLCGQTTLGQYATSTLRFNSVTDYLFTPIVERIRQALPAANAADGDSQSPSFDDWIRLSYKFMNYARRSLLPDEKALQAILQLEIKQAMVTVMGRTYYRNISPTHVCILTDRELIMIREAIGLSGSSRYGGIWDYIPLDKIIALSLTAQSGREPELSIQLPGNESLKFLYQASARPDLEQLLDQCRHLTSR